MFSISKLPISSERKQALRAGEDFKNNDELSQISYQYDISITPLIKNEDHLGYIFSLQPVANSNKKSALLTAHSEINVGQMLAPFQKSKLRFVAPPEAVLVSSTRIYANILATKSSINKVCDTQPNICTGKNVPEYALESDSKIFTLFDACEIMVNQRSKPITSDTFDLIVLKPNKGRDIMMSEIVLLIDGNYDKVLSHICRAKPIHLLCENTLHFSPLKDIEVLSKSFI